jgi:REP-associated tyrosine transposase
MPRIARVIVPGVPHHITQRGNRGCDVFLTDEHRSRYLELLKEYADEHGLRIDAYCLMTNHVHLVATPETVESLEAVLRPLHVRHSQTINRYLGERGVLWQGRPYSCPLDEEHFWAAVRYVEMNPVRAKMVKRAERYAWSSAAAHCGVRDDPLAADLSSGPVEPSGWAEWLQEDEDEAALETLRKKTRTGLPAGSSEFVTVLEEILGRVLHRGKPGRPRKKR